MKVNATAPAKNARPDDRESRDAHEDANDHQPRRDRRTDLGDGHNGLPDFHHEIATSVLLGVAHLVRNDRDLRD